MMPFYVLRPGLSARGGPADTLPLTVEENKIAGQTSDGAH